MFSFHGRPSSWDHLVLIIYVNGLLDLISLSYSDDRLTKLFVQLSDCLILFIECLIGFRFHLY
jgi:hypothetical protein